MPARAHRTIDRVVQILEEIASSPDGTSLTGLATKLEIPKSTVQGFVNGLIDAGYVEEQGWRFYLGPGAYMLAQRNSPAILRLVNNSDLRNVHTDTKCSVLAGVLVGHNLMYVDSVLGGVHEGYFLHRRPRRPALLTAGGQVLVAAMQRDLMHEFLATQESEAVEGFLRRVDQILEDGYCYVPDSISPETSALAVPLRDCAGSVVGALVVTSTKPDMRRRKAKLVSYLKETAEMLVDRSRSTRA